jgi:mRNA interferase RelE/StbE
MFKVEVMAPVYDYIRRLAPEQRRTLKKALKELDHEHGDIRALEQALTGYYRLRVGKFRIIFRYPSASTIEAVFIEERGIVYEVFEEQFLAKLRT